MSLAVFEELNSVNIILSCSHIILNSIVITTPVGLAFQCLRLPRDVAEYFVGPLLGLYVLQMAMVFVLAVPLRDVMRAAVTITMLDFAHSGVLATVCCQGMFCFCVYFLWSCQGLVDSFLAFF